MDRSRIGWTSCPLVVETGSDRIRTVPLPTAFRDGWLDGAHRRSESPHRTPRMVREEFAAGGSPRKEITGMPFSGVRHGVSTARRKEGLSRRMPPTGGTLRSTAEVPSNGV